MSGHVDIKAVTWARNMAHVERATLGKYTIRIDPGMDSVGWSVWDDEGAYLPTMQGRTPTVTEAKVAALQSIKVKEIHDA